MKTVKCNTCGSSTRFVFMVSSECFCSAGCLHHKYSDSQFRLLMSMGEASIINGTVPGDNSYAFITKSVYDIYEKIKESYCK